MSDVSSPALSSTLVPHLEAYSEEEWRQAEAWPAIARYRSLLARAGDSTDLKTTLRLKRHRLWLRAAVATYFDRVPAKDVCLFWSDGADELLGDAWKASGCDKSSLALLALGKLGSRELNLSSDVDLIAVRASDREPDLKAFREFQLLLTDATEFASCLRLDFTLRPGGRASTALPTVSEFENHYGYQGEMWERLAYVRLRILQGPQDLREEIGSFARKFSYRKHLDYTVLEDLKSLRAKIRAERFEQTPGTYHLKLGVGGIRELELFVHALQVLHGGRHPVLQTGSTSGALVQLQALGHLDAVKSSFLREAYWALRRIENRLQAFEDQQTYLVDFKNPQEALPKDFADILDQTCSKVATVATSLFGSADSRGELPVTLEGQMEWLKDKGFSVDSCETTWPALMSATAQSRRSGADEQERLAFLQGFVTKLAELKLDLDLGLSLLLDFVKGVRAKASFFTLLNRESRVRDELATLFSVSPYLGNVLALRPELIDEFIYRKTAEPPSDFNLLLEELTERRLLAELIAGTQFIVDREVRKQTLNLTANADAIATTLLERLKTDHAASNIGLIPLGKWGGREMGLRSDLDFIFVTPNPPTAEDQKTAKRFLSRMTEPHRGGSIYAIDMRLRPSGASGPIMVSHEDLKKYLLESAAAWERQAYLRARPLSVLPFHPAEVAASRGLSQEDLEQLRSINERLFVNEASSTAKGELDLKLSRGGLADVEFTAQIALLSLKEFSLDPSTYGMIQYLESLDEKWAEAGPSIREGYGALRGIEQLYQLTTSNSGSKMRPKSDEFRRLSLVLKCSADDLEAQVRSIFSRLLQRLEVLRV